VATSARQRPRDDRAWPRGAFITSLALGVLAAAAGVAIVLAAADSGWVWAAVVGAAFVGTAALALGVLRRMTRAWLRDSHQPGGSVTLALALGGAVLVLAFVDLAVGGALFAGLMTGTCWGNAAAIRSARANRPAVEAFEAAESREPRPATLPRLTTTSADGSDRPDLGGALRDAVATERRRWLAWLAAGVLVTVGCLALEAVGAALVVAMTPSPRSSGSRAAWSVPSWPTTTSAPRGPLRAAPTSSSCTIPRPA
jgi:hypothetical protein